MKTACIVYALLLGAAPLAACGGSGSSGALSDNDGGTHDPTAPLADGGTQVDAAPKTPDPTCRHIKSNTVPTPPGVSISVTTQACTFTLAEAQAGIKIDYDVTIDNDMEVTQDAFEPLREVYVNEALTDASSELFPCEGHRAPNEQSVSLKKGVYHRSFKWDGYRWSAPADSCHKDKPAGVGEYELTLTITLSPAGAGTKIVQSTQTGFAIRLVP